MGFGCLICTSFRLAVYHWCWWQSRQDPGQLQYMWVTKNLDFGKNSYIFWVHSYTIGAYAAAKNPRRIPGFGYFWQIEWVFSQNSYLKKPVCCVPFWAPKQIHTHLVPTISQNLQKIHTFWLPTYTGAVRGPEPSRLCKLGQRAPLWTKLLVFSLSYTSSNLTNPSLCGRKSGWALCPADRREGLTA